MAKQNVINKVEDYLQFIKESGVTTINKTQSIKKTRKVIENFKENSVIQNKTYVSITDDWKNAKNISELRQIISGCCECSLYQNRTNFVFGEGNPKADIMIIGEAPGRDEDLQGMPFVGRAGQLLTKILESIGLTRDEVFIGNICKCRPPENRVPESIEVEKCEPYLIKQIELINPEFILSLGLTSFNTLMKTKSKMADIRGQMFDYHGKKLLVTYHPAALLRNPNWKRDVWEDMKNLKKLYDEFKENKEVK